MEVEEIKNNKEEEIENIDSIPIKIEDNNNKEINEIINLKKEEDNPQIKINEDLLALNNINIEKNENENVMDNNKLNNNIENQNIKEYDELAEEFSLINIDIEKEKNEKIKRIEKNKEKIEKEIEEEEENINKINIEDEQEDNNENDEQNPEDLKVDDYLFNENEINHFKYNKEYTDNDEDLHSRRLTARNNDD